MPPHSRPVRRGSSTGLAVPPWLRLLPPIPLADPYLNPLWLETGDLILPNLTLILSLQLLTPDLSNLNSLFPS